MNSELLHQIAPGYWFWFFDEQEIRDAYWKVNTDDVVIDIGCHIGSYTHPALEIGAKVFAIDPDKRYTDALQYVADDTSGLTVINLALGEYSEEFLEMLETSEYENMNVWIKNPYVFSSLDKVVDQYKIEKIDWIKIDVEGAELSVLKGGEESLKKFKPKMIIEAHDLVYPFVKRMNSSELCHQFLNKIEYEVEDIQYKGINTPERTFWICKIKGM